MTPFVRPPRLRAVRAANPPSQAFTGGEFRDVAGKHSHSPALAADAKIRLFRSLFRGRDDVYPRRFESRKTGKAGYAPACANEWIRGICEKPRIKCAECINQRFLPLTDEVVRWHLLGADPTGAPFVAGIYPMLQDETCFLLAADFDNDGWQDDAGACLATCKTLGIPAALERSRSGYGGHVWLFFNEATPAAAARRLGSFVLTETMERHPGIGFGSYDRFFPNQDTLPQGGFGNLIALPLQKQPRELGNSVFLDDAMSPHADQWAFLASVEKIGRGRLEDIVRDAERRGRVVGVRFPELEEDDAAFLEPWTVAPSRRRKELPIDAELPGTLELVVGNEIYIPKDGLPPALRIRLIRLAAFQNPEFYKAQSMRLPTYDKPRIIACAEEYPNHIGLPRGCMDDVMRLLTDLGIAPVLREERFHGRPLDVCFQGNLRPEQDVAARALLARDIGVLAATTAFGKTVVAAWLIAERRVNTLVLVHRRQLLDQWVERLSAFLGVSHRDIGRIGGGRRRATGALDVAVIQSLVRDGVIDDCVGDYGHVIVDECHHLSAHSFEQVVRRAKARFVAGLSATVTRKDGHHPIIFMQCGPVRHRVSAKAEAMRHPFSHAVLVRPTMFQPVALPSADKRMAFASLYRDLIVDEARNRGIVEDVVQAVKAGRSPLVLTERNDHLDDLAGRLAEQVRNVIVLRGGMGRKQREAKTAELAAIPADEERVILATGRYVGEGFDDARLDTLFLTLPVSWHGTIAQYAGRLHRLYDGKREARVYDYADLNVPMLARMFERRCRGYEAIGYTISLPASAVPGWPADVVLPSDPEWKRDYAASVRRLVQDGVDTPLATLFSGAARARSASEAFLYRRLETLAETRGRFQLNAVLPIPFDGFGQMEVDFLAERERIALEVDGEQHLSDKTAYRRDRKKDRLLQQRGYIVLRFLAEDLAKDLDSVLDSIQHSLAGRREAARTAP
ncbi:MAG TPA: DEAD/DEAH box helicase family protein [Hyphomonadaceae bacterium]|nr:DEAD/DEAH box helicase family protein [Hyphomonadaceae bacterium]